VLAKGDTVLHPGETVTLLLPGGGGMGPAAGPDKGGGSGHASAAALAVNGPSFRLMRERLAGRRRAVGSPWRRRARASGTMARGHSRCGSAR
jgi:hypothetical protein